jgi:SMI1 / KNR4 family (SUKH-1)
MALPQEVVRALAGTVYRRVTPERVREALSSLRTQLPEGFRTFFERYQGPFGSSTTGFQLLDLFEGPDTIISSTEVCRQEHGFLDRHLVLSDYLGNAVLVLDARDNRVYNVDFEGADQALLAGTLAWTWPSFEDFLRDYFGAPEPGDGDAAEQGDEADEA